MLRNVLLLSLLLAGCSDSAGPGGPCKADLTCGDGLVCNFQAVMPICLANDEDEDGDGLKNQQDFCPATAGGSNHDEDGDKQGDVCDKCPIETFRANQLDADGDGLAGLCDPLDSEKGDKLVFFEGFGKPDALATWTLDDATHFTIANDALKVTVTAADPEALAVYALPEQKESTAVFTAYHVVDAAPAGVDNASRIIAVSTYNNTPAAGVGRARCGASSESGQAGGIRLTTDLGERNQGFASSFAMGEPYRLLLQSEGGNARCVQIRGQNTAVAENPVSGDGKGAVSFTVRSVSADYNYLLVVQSPNR
jgi:hypothetical protein